MKFRVAAMLAAVASTLTVLGVLAPGAATAATAPGARAVTASACTMADRVDASGVRVRTAPNLSAAAVGQLSAGTEVTANCYSVQGAKYTACGFTESWWVVLLYAGHWRYSPAACYTPLASLRWT